jgi:predicted RND superfamily exporter protein
MPQDIAELKELRQLREITGYGGELRFMVEAEDVTDVQFLQWLKDFQEEELARYDEILSFNSPASLVSQAAGGDIPDQQQVDAILANMPSLYKDQVVSADGGMASLSFTLKYMSLEDIHDLLVLIEQDVQLPQGVTMSTVGSYAIGVLTVDSVTGNRLVMNLLCLGAMFFVLLIAYRRLTSTIFTMGVIVIGIGTEFMVLLLGRYNEEKQKGEPPAEAMVTALSKIGRAIVVTAVTTLGGFGVLIASNFVMIRDFGIAAVLSVVLCLISTITVMPPLIGWLDKRIPKTKIKI